MMIQTIHDPVPDNAKMIVNEGEVTKVYFADDQEVIDEQLAIKKNSQAAELRESFESHLSAGYIVNGSTYSLDTDDILDLTGLIGLGNDGEYRVKGGKFKAHTLPELNQVRDEGVAAKYAAHHKYETLQDSINNAATIDVVNAIKW